MSIRINATLQEARAAAGHTKEQWDRFYFITKDEAKKLSEAHKDWSRWILIPANEKEYMLERVNGRLQAEGIRPVEMIILKWRISQLLRDIQRKFSEGSMLRDVGSLSQMQVQRHSDSTGNPGSDSGYGGSKYTISTDDTLRLRRDFPESWNAVAPQFHPLTSAWANSAEYTGLLEMFQARTGNQEARFKDNEDPDGEEKVEDQNLSRRDEDKHSDHSLLTDVENRATSDFFTNNYLSATPVDPDRKSKSTTFEKQNMPGRHYRPLSDEIRRKFLVSLREKWEIRPESPFSPQGFELTLLSSRLAPSSLEEGMALFEALVSTCPVNARTEMLNSILQHVERDLPLERWWTTAGTGDVADVKRQSVSSVKDAFDKFVRLLEEKWRLEDDGSRVDEADKVYEQIRQMFYVSKGKLDEAMNYFETIAGACDQDKRAGLLYSILQRVKEGDALAQWRASEIDRHAEREDPEAFRPGVPREGPSISSTKLADVRGAQKNSLEFITATDPSDFMSRKHRTTVRKSVMSSNLSKDEHAPPQYTPDRKKLPIVAPSRRYNRNNGHSNEHDTSVSRFATPQSLPSLTERSTISPQRGSSPWTPNEIESATLGKLSTPGTSHMDAIMEVDDALEPGDIEDQDPLHRPGRRLSSKYKNSDGSAMSRRKLQNMLAQKAFLDRKKRLEEANGEDQESEKEEQVTTMAEPDTTNVDLSQEVLMYQLPGEQVLIQCVCGNVNDGRFIIPCITCGMWQHIRCYYQLAQDVVEDHECVRCDPRELNGQEVVQPKRVTEADPALDVASTATQSVQRPKTVGAESSLAPSIIPPIGKETREVMASKPKDQNMDDGTISIMGLSHSPTIATSLSASKSNYQNVPEGFKSPGVVYPTSLSTNLTSKRGSHKIAEQGRRNRINMAIQEMNTLLPSKQTASAHTMDEANVSKALTIESAIAYIKQLQDQVREKDRLLEEKDRHIERLETVDPTTINTPHWNKTDIPDADAAIEPYKDPGTVGTLDSGFADDWLTLDDGEALRPNPWSQQVTSLSPSEPEEVTQNESDTPKALRNDDTKQRSPENEFGDGLFEYADIYNAPRTYSYLGPIKSPSARILEPTHSPNQMLSRMSLHKPVVAIDAIVAESSDAGIKREDKEDSPMEELVEVLPDAHTLISLKVDLETDWEMVQAKLPETWKWDVEYQPSYWTCTPFELDEPKYYPLTIAGAPVVLPVEYQWPPTGGVNPPPDPRPSAPIDCTASLSLEIVRDLFLTFEKSIGFYLLINGLLQIIVPDDFDTAWASSHLPHKYGGLKVCYISQTLEGTMLPSAIETAKTKPNLNAQSTGLSSLFRPSRQSTASSSPSLRLNDFIEARPKSNHRKEKYAGRIGLKVLKAGEPYLVMSTHIITEAILAKSHRETFFGRGRGRFDKLDDDWNEHVDIWAGNERIGTIDQTFDQEAEVYPNGFHHDITLIKPLSPNSVKDIASPIPNLGWLHRDSWASLRQQTSPVKILGSTEDHRSAKTIKCSRPSEILVVGEGIFRNQIASAGTSKSLKDHDMSTWKNLVSRALLYRVHPDFEPPNGYSGVALYADGMREDGTHGPGIVGFQSFVQRSGQVQSFGMEGPALERRLQLGRIAFYGAFEVPEGMREYVIA